MPLFNPMRRSYRWCAKHLVLLASCSLALGLLVTFDRMLADKDRINPVFFSNYKLIDRLSQDPLPWVAIGIVNLVLLPILARRRVMYEPERTHRRGGDIPATFQ